MTGSFLHPFSAPAKESFTSLVRGEGSTVWDADGNAYIDAMASLWYCNVGHGRRDMAEAIARQITELETYSCFDPFTNPPADELADRLAALSPISDARVFLCQSGSEAIDTAMKIARTAQAQAGHPERQLIITRERGYHGTNYGGTSAQGLAYNKVGWGELLAEVVQVPADDIEGLASLMAERSGEIAAVIAEPVQGAAGVWPPEPGYLESLRRLCDQHGAYLVFDEVITGFGRLGSWFAAHHYGITPDMTTFAKGVTSGYLPLGGVLMNGSIRDALESDPEFKLMHGYTYSGHATSCVAALTNIDIIEREGLIQQASLIGERLSAGLQALADDGSIAGVRGVGAMWGIAMHPDQSAPEIRERVLANGVIVRAIGDHSVTFCPPLVITDAEIDRVIDAVAGAVSA